MSLPNQFKRVTLTDAALQLGIHPYDFVRILEALNRFPDELRFTEAEVDDLRQAGGLETWWTPEAEAERLRQSDRNAVRGMARGVAFQFLSHQVLGRSTTRLDNLYRGLDPEAQPFATLVLSTLLQEGYLQTVNTPAGLNISVVPQRADDLRRIARGESYPPALSQHWGA